MSASRLAQAAIQPWAVALQVTPLPAIAPLIIIWVGQPFVALVVCATIVAFFPLFANTATGLASPPPELNDLFRLYGASRWRTMALLRLPAALPYFLSGLRISGGLALVGAVVAELVAGSGGFASGLAYRILEASFRLEMPRMFAALVLLALAGIVLNFGLGAMGQAILRRQGRGMNRLLIFGLGYSGRAIADAAEAAGFEVSGTTRRRIGRQHPVRCRRSGSRRRDPSADHRRAGRSGRSGAGAAIAPRSTRRRPAVDRLSVQHRRLWRPGGGWVDEDTPAAPVAGTRAMRVARRTTGQRFADRRAVDIFRLAGIYGPGRSAFDDLRAGRARRMIKPGHQFGRIHRDDIAQAVVAAMRQDRAAGPRVFNLADDEPSESAAVVTEAAALLGVPRRRPRVSPMRCRR